VTPQPPIAFARCRNGCILVGSGARSNTGIISLELFFEDPQQCDSYYFDTGKLFLQLKKSNVRNLSGLYDIPV